MTLDAHSTPRVRAMVVESADRGASRLAPLDRSVLLRDLAAYRRDEGRGPLRTIRPRSSRKRTLARSWLQAFGGADRESQESSFPRGLHGAGKALPLLPRRPLRPGSEVRGGPCFFWDAAAFESAQGRRGSGTPRRSNYLQPLVVNPSRTTEARPKNGPAHRSQGAGHCDDPQASFPERRSNLFAS